MHDTLVLTPMGAVAWLVFGFLFGFGWSLASFVVGRLTAPRR